VKNKITETILAVHPVNTGEIQELLSQVTDFIDI
jgi:hypothetical protein